MMGATQVLALTCAVILEEGFARSDLERIQASIRSTCREAGAVIVTGDTKVMGRGELDGIVLNTTGIGLTERVVPDSGLRPGDRILVTGTMGDHGFAIMALRKVASTGRSPLGRGPAQRSHRVRARRRRGRGDGDEGPDPRGAVERAPRDGRQEWCRDRAGRTVRARVAGRGAAADLLAGIDPLHIANEGKVLGVRSERADRVLAALQSHPLGEQAAIVGTCIA